MPRRLAQTILAAALTLMTRAGLAQVPRPYPPRCLRSELFPRQLPRTVSD